MILQELSEANGISSHEDAVRKIILKAIANHVENIRIDALGNVTAHKPAATGKGKLRVMLDAHMDEVGFMALGVDNDGLLRFTPVGGIDPRILPGLRVRIGKKALPGAIIWVPIHKNREQNTVKIENLRIDIGASNKEGVNSKVKPGDPIAFDSQFMELGERTLRGKAFDDRAGCALLVDVLQGGAYPVDIVAAFTVQEEVGLRGARVAAQSLKPDVAFALECTSAFDMPDPSGNPDDHDQTNPSTRLGHGPALTVMDRSMITQPRLLRFLRETAESNNIPYQLKTALGGGTDAGAIHTSNAGIPAAVISIPIRYMHTPAAYLYRSDYNNALRLVQATLNSITPHVLERE